MKTTPRPTAPYPPTPAARRPEQRLETGMPPRLEGRFKDSWLRDGRDTAAGPRRGGGTAADTDCGDLRRAPRPEPRVSRRVR
ncbi:hypothetical protein [Microbaculum marinum]|uniref:Uncharacterized protein n=1 Tax=Microbaculum marinum TaxID=1764581 RepID=A0AAW9RY20_9HYPH